MNIVSMSGIAARRIRPMDQEFIIDSVVRLAACMDIVCSKEDVEVTPFFS